MHVELCVNNAKDPVKVGAPGKVDKAQAMILIRSTWLHSTWIDGKSAGWITGRNACGDSNMELELAID